MQGKRRGNQGHTQAVEAASLTGWMTNKEDKSLLHSQLHLGLI